MNKNRSRQKGGGLQHCVCTGLGGVSHREAVDEQVGVCWIGGGMCRPLGDRVGLAMTKVCSCVHLLKVSTYL